MKSRITGEKLPSMLQQREMLRGVSQRLVAHSIGDEVFVSSQIPIAALRDARFGNSSIQNYARPPVARSPRDVVFDHEPKNSLLHKPEGSYSFELGDGKTYNCILDERDAAVRRTETVSSAENFLGMLSIKFVDVKAKAL